MVRELYESPAAFRMAIESRLRTESALRGMDSQRLRQLLAFDRFLARLFAAFQDAIMLKGGLVLEMRLSRARATKDIDLRMVGSPDNILHRLQETGRLDLGDYLRFEVQTDPDLPELEADGMKYTGRRYRCEPLLAGRRFRLLGLVRDFDSEVLRSAILQTFRHRDTHSIPATVPAPPP